MLLARVGNDDLMSIASEKCVYLRLMERLYGHVVDRMNLELLIKYVLKWFPLLPLRRDGNSWVNVTNDVEFVRQSSAQETLSNDVNVVAELQ